MRISDWISAVRSSDLRRLSPHMQRIRFEARDIPRYATGGLHIRLLIPPAVRNPVWPTIGHDGLLVWPAGDDALTVRIYTIRTIDVEAGTFDRSEEHTSELQSLMRISYAVFCLKKKKKHNKTQ